jgi:hypothetical protein
MITIFYEVIGMYTLPSPADLHRQKFYLSQREREMEKEGRKVVIIDVLGDVWSK